MKMAFYNQITLENMAYGIPPLNIHTEGKRQTLEKRGLFNILQPDIFQMNPLSKYYYSCHRTHLGNTG